jgi:hypothetical protein
MRRDRILAGMAAGLIAGAVFGLILQMLMAPTPEGARIPMMAMVAKVVRSDSMLVGWLYHLFNSAVIGAIFGWITHITAYGRGLCWGALYGAFWWVLGGLVLMPILLGMPAFAPIAIEPMRPVAIGSLIGHLVYGLILGGFYVGFLRRAGTPAAQVRRVA